MLKLTRLFIGLAFYCNAEIKIKNYHSNFLYIYTFVEVKIKEFIHVIYDL